MGHSWAGNSPSRRFWPLIGLGCLIASLGILGPHMAYSQTQETEEKIDITNLGQCGLVTRYASTQIGDTCLQEATNVYLDEDAGIVRRKGFADFNSSALANSPPVRGIWPFRATDGTEYMVVLSSETLYQSSGGAFTAISPEISGFSRTDDMDCTQCLGRLWCVNRSQDLTFWNGTSTGTVSGAPVCGQIKCHRNRVVMGNCTLTLSQLRLSGELDGTDWTIPSAPVSTSPASLSVGGVNDGNNLLCIMGVYQDVLVMGKRDSAWGLYGFDRRDFAIRQLSQEVGCIEPRSAREKQGSLYWLSKRGLEKMTGPSIKRVSDPIRDLMDTIIVAGGNSRSATDTGQTDFDAGNLTASGPGAPVSTTINPANVVPSSWSITESTTQFVLGTLVNVSTSVNPGRLTLIQGSSASFINAGAESQNNTTNWTTEPGYVSFSTYADTSMYGSIAFQGFSRACLATNNISFLVGQSNGINLDSELNAQITDGLGATELILDTRRSATPRIHIIVTESGTGTIAGMRSEEFMAGTFVRIKYKDADSSGNCQPAFDIDENNIITTGTYTTIRYDTSFTTPTWGPLLVTMTSSTISSLTFQTQVSTASVGGETAQLSQTPGAKIASAVRRYLITTASFTVTATTNAIIPTFTDLSLQAATTAYFISQSRNPGTAITQWGSLQCNRALNDGNMTFYISTGTSSNQVTRATATWTLQTNNTVITVATASFVAYRVLFDIDSGTETPTLNDCTINWNEGTTRPSVAAEVYRDRYYLAYTTATSGTVANTNILVADSRDQWTLHDAPNCTSLGIYNRNLYCGDSGSNGQVYEMDIGQDDDGATFTSSIRTKDFDCGNPFQKKMLSRIYYNLGGNPDQSFSITLTPSYSLDASTDAVTLDGIALSEDYSRFIAAKVPADLSSNVSGRWFNFALTHTGLQGPWKLFGLRIAFSRLKED